MGLQIIMQLNSQLAIWDSISSAIVAWDCTPEEVIGYMVDRERDRITDEVNRVVDELKKGGRPYYQFTKTWAEALKHMEDVHGREALEELVHSMDVEEPPA